VVSFLIEVIVDGRVNGGEFLQTSHLPKPQHGTLSSSKRKVRIFNAVVKPPALLLFLSISYVSHSRAIRP
jgi:hypothetical protein